MKSTTYTLKNIGKTILTVAAVPFMLAAVAVWALVIFGKLAITELFNKRQSFNTVRSR